MSQVGALRSKMMLDVYPQLEQRVQGDYGRSLDRRHRYLGRPMGTWAAASDH